MQRLLKKYDFEYPRELIAQKPANPRDTARLLVYDRKKNKIFFDRFYNLGKYLPKDALLVFNQTRVIPARLVAYKPTGGKVQLLYISKNKTGIFTLANSHLTQGQKLYLTKKTNLTLTVQKKLGNHYFLKPDFKLSALERILKKHGLTPLPPYLRKSPLSEAKRRQAYQTIFAKEGESVAAPTASLHFTEQLLKSLQKNKIKTTTVRLDVSLGTFAPLTDTQLKEKKLHKENYNINAIAKKAIAEAKNKKRPIIAVGTTVVRTLETYAKNKKTSGSTNLFIQPPYKPMLCSGLITNFHVPKSSLLMLVSAFVGNRKLLNLYKTAIGKKFRLFSFGDGMLII